MRRAAERYETRIVPRSGAAGALAKVIAIIFSVAIADHLPQPGGEVEIVDKSSGDVVAAHSRKVVPIDSVKVLINRDLEMMTVDDFAAKWIA